MLEGKTAIITGGSSGIGKAIAEIFAEDGANLILVARNEERLKNAVNSLKGKNHTYYPMDISNKDAIIKLVDEVVEKYKKIDVLVNNAGGFEPASINEASYDSLDRRLNELKGALYFTKSLMPIFKKQKSGVILDVLSTAAIIAFSGNNAYSTSKFGHRAFSIIAEEELKLDNVKVYRIYPGNTKTYLWERDKTKMKEEIGKNPQLEAREIAEEAFKLISNQYRSHDLLVKPDEKSNKIVKEIGEYDFGEKILGGE